jgi:hypothetical protein
MTTDKSAVKSLRIYGEGSCLSKSRSVEGKEEGKAGAPKQKMMIRQNGNRRTQQNDSEVQRLSEGEEGTLV